MTALCVYVDRDGYCFPSQEKLAEDLGYSTTTVREGLKELGYYGWLQVVRRRRKSSSKRLTNCYLISAYGNDLPKANFKKQKADLAWLEKHGKTANGQAADARPKGDGENHEAGPCSYDKSKTRAATATDPGVMKNSQPRSCGKQPIHPTNSPSELE